MKFKIMLNRDAAFIDYINMLLNNQNYFMPVDLKEPLSNLYSINFSYNEKIDEIKKEYSKNINRFILGAHRYFIEYWKSNYNELNSEKKLIDEIIKNYGEYITKTISKLTRVSWKKNNLIIILTLRSGGMNDGNILFIGVNKKFRKLYIETLIHELIHANTHFMISKTKFSEEDEEIATTFITNEVIKQLNKEYKVKIKQQSFSNNLNDKDLNKKYSNEIIINSKSFIELIKNINKNRKINKN